MNLDAEAIGKRICLLRTDRKMTQEQLAEKLNISANQLSRIENGRRGCTIEFLLDVGTMFDVSLNYLVLGREYVNQSVGQSIDEIIAALEELKGSI